MSTQAPASAANSAKSTSTQKRVKFTVEWTLPVSQTSALGGKTDKNLTKEDRYNLFYLRACVKRGARIVSEAPVAE